MPAGIPPAWRWCRLDGVCSGLFDCPHSTPVYADTGPFIVRSQDIRGGVFATTDATRVDEATYRERVARAEPRHGDLFFSREGTYFGIAAEVPPRTQVCLGQRMVLLRPDPQVIDARYLRYWLNSATMVAHMHGFRDGTVAERLNLAIIRALPVLVPRLNEQRAIAAVLGALDDKIDLNRRMNETLEAMARAIFKSWFVDFDPVRARAEGRPAPQPIAHLFPSTFVESRLRLVPDGWDDSPIRDLATVERGLSYKGEFLRDEGRPLINLGCFEGHGRFSMRNLKHYAGEFKQRHVVRPGDVVIANTDITQKRQVLGSPAIIPGSEETEYLFSHHVYALRFHGGQEHWRTFLYFALLQDDFRERAEGFATGTTVLALPGEAVLDHVVVKPGVEVLREFMRIAGPMLSMMQQKIEESATLAVVRDHLLPKLLSGEIRVKDAEKLAEAAL